MEDHDEIVINHSQQLGDMNARINEAHTRITSLLSFGNDIKSLVTDFNQLSKDVTTLVGTTTQLTKDMTRIVDQLDKHNTRIDLLEDNMETKETISKMREEINDIKNKPAIDMLNAVNKLKWGFLLAIVASLGTAIGTLIILLIRL